MIFSASRPCIAAQVLRATTATPPRGENFAGGGVPSSRTILTTPGTFSAALSSTEATVPPSTGGRATTANSIPGITVSWPYFARPVEMSKPSVSGRVPLPM